MRGKLIVLCGTDGSGKATQAKLLADRLKKEGHSVQMADFPQYGKSFFSQLIQQYLNGKFGAAAQVDPCFASLMYAGDRFEAKEKLNQWLSQGNIVIANRYVSANKAHQGGKIQNRKKREEFLKWVDQLEYQVFKVPVPHLNIFLNVPYEVGQKLVEKKGSREYLGRKKKDIHEKDPRHLRQAYNLYLEMAEQYHNWVKVDCVKHNQLLTEQQIAEKVWKIVRYLL